MKEKKAPILFTSDADCSGCGVCVDKCPSKAISFKDNKNGFRYPIIDYNLCVGCNSCVNVCDFHKKSDCEVNRHQPRKCYAAKHKVRPILQQSSSGGMFSALAEYVILQKCGVVYGCVMNDDWSVFHTRTESIEGVNPMRGSKYVQSNMSSIYRQVKDALIANRTVLFTGTPCQCAALYSFLGGKNLYEELITMDFVCHGVVGNSFYKQYISGIENRLKARLIKFNFRSKALGWGRSIYEYSYKKAGKILTKRYSYNSEDFYPLYYSKGSLMRESCFVCKYASPERVSDFTVGDFWGFDKMKYRIKFSVELGLSILLANTDKALFILDKLNIEKQKISLDDAKKFNQSLNQPVQKGKHWDTMMKLYQEGSVGSYIKKTTLRQKVSEFIVTHLQTKYLFKLKKIL